VFDALKAGKADLTFTNASEARRARRLHAGAGARGIGLPGVGGFGHHRHRADRPAGVPSACPQGGSSHATLTRELKQARVVPLPRRWTWRSAC
jgi:hypothetical protein